MADLGSDFHCVHDLDPNLTVVSGRLALAQCIARRVLAEQGSLFYDPAYGGGLGQVLGGPIREGNVERAIVLEALKDERLDDAAARVTVAGDAVTAELLLVDGDGPFNLTLSIGDVSTETLSENL